MTPEQRAKEIVDWMVANDYLKGTPAGWQVYVRVGIVAHIKAAVADEREACANALASLDWSDHQPHECAEFIRKRSQEPVQPTMIMCKPRELEDVKRILAATDQSDTVCNPPANPS